MRGVRWARSSSRSSFVDSLPAPRASERCAFGFTLIIDDIKAVMISAAESVPLMMTLPAWCPTNTGILMAENISGGVLRRRSQQIGSARFSAAAAEGLSLRRVVAKLERRGVRSRIVSAAEKKAAAILAGIAGVEGRAGTLQRSASASTSV